ncbi:MAG: lysozyme inhibitor LprI family protein [Pseudomonadota bacterium]|nr:lysozyme inhibitor LprI family protein [Pseudomonadota bacterium]
MFRRFLAIASISACTCVGAAPPPFCWGDKPDPIDLVLEQDLEKSGGVTSEMRDAQGRAYEAWDKRLNAAYQTLQSKVSTTDRKLLIEAQREWLKFRETHFQFVWSQSMLAQDGTRAPVIVGDWSREMLKQRVCELESAIQYLKASDR